MAGSKSSSDAGVSDRRFRERLAADIEQRYDRLVSMLDDAMQATRKVSLQCPSCGRMAPVVVPNERAALEVARFFTEYGFGRPGVAEAPETERVVFRRVVVGDEASEEQIERAFRADALLCEQEGVK